MSVKLENYAVSMKNLNEHVKRLQNENKELNKLKQQVTHLSGILSIITQENKNLFSELQVVTLERNKLQIALAIKEQTLARKAKSHSTPTSEVTENGDKPKELNKQLQTIEHLRSKQLFHEQKSATNSPLPLFHRNITTRSSPLSGISQSLYRNGSVTSFETPSPSSDHLMSFGQEDGVEKNDDLPAVTNVNDQKNSSMEEHFNLDKLSKLKEEIKSIFSEIRQIGKEISTRQLVDFGIEDLSSDLNWSDESHKDIVNDVHISELDTN